jgi:hypothetical protein
MRAVDIKIFLNSFGARVKMQKYFSTRGRPVRAAGPSVTKNAMRAEPGPGTFFENIFEFPDNKPNEVANRRRAFSAS